MSAESTACLSLSFLPCKNVQESLYSISFFNSSRFKRLQLRSDLEACLCSHPCWTVCSSALWTVYISGPRKLQKRRTKIAKFARLTKLNRHLRSSATYQCNLGSDLKPVYRSLCRSLCLVFFKSWSCETQVSTNSAQKGEDISERIRKEEIKGT